MEKLVTRNVIIYHAIIGRTDKVDGNYKILDTVELESYKPITRAGIKEYTDVNELPDHRLIEKFTTIETYAMPLEFFIQNAEKVGKPTEKVIANKEDK
ncbi:MAG: hypothetical protein K2O64_06185 [Lactobacillus sp.]|nr:hypothetical protein [Lactobacillus sp.]